MLEKAQRTASITDDKAHGFLEDLRSLDITVEEARFGHIFGDVHRLAVVYRLSGYDAAYLELAIRKGPSLGHPRRGLAGCRRGCGHRTISTHILAEPQEFLRCR